jgi:hypothetical protein
MIMIIGFVGVAAFIVSMQLQSIFRARLLNLLSSFFIGTYGVLIHSFPILTMGLILAGINIYSVIKIKGKKESLKILEVQNQSEYLQEFIQFYRKDIFRYFPNFDFTVLQSDRVFFILRNMAVAGLVISRKQDEKYLQIVLDYVIPQYRDFKLGRFLYFDSKQYFRKFGFENLISTCYNSQHEEYLLKMGFSEKFINQQRFFVLHL